MRTDAAGKCWMTIAFSDLRKINGGKAIAAIRGIPDSTAEITRSRRPCQAEEPDVPGGRAYHGILIKTFDC
jgi:hypothetical protein